MVRLITQLFSTDNSIENLISDQATGNISLMTLEALNTKDVNIEISGQENQTNLSSSNLMPMFSSR